MDFAPGYEDFATRYYWARLLTPPKCCGCFSNHFGSGIACLIWAGFSFYFAVLAFMQKSPFYSHLDQVPLIIFGVVNLIFGCISIAGFVIVYFRPIYVRVQIMVYVIAIGATLVLISTLINFILFVVNQDAFRNWCVDDSRTKTLRNIQNQSGGNTTVTLGSDIDYYNCDRLFANQVKWSLLCVIAMYIIYVHWMLVYAGFAGTSFFLIPPRNTAIGMPPPPPSVPGGPMESLPPPPPTTIVPPTELSNLAPSSAAIEKDIEQQRYQYEQQTFYNLKPNNNNNKKPMKKKKSVDPNLLSILGLKVNESGRVIHMTDDQDYLPRYSTCGDDIQYYDDDNHYYSEKKKQKHIKRQASSSSKTFVPSIVQQDNDDDLR